MEESGDATIASQMARAEQNLDRLIDWVGRHDSKSSVILGIATAMLGYLATAVPRLSQCTIGVGLDALASTALLGASLLFVHLGNWPRVEGPPSLIFFGAIAALDFKAYRAAFTSAEPGEYLDDVLRQCHVLSRIVKRKFWALRWAYRLLFAAMAPWAAAVYLLKFA